MYYKYVMTPDQLSMESISGSHHADEQCAWSTVIRRIYQERNIMVTYLLLVLVCCLLGQFDSSEFLNMHKMLIDHDSAHTIHL